MPPSSRRGVLRAVGTALPVALAGCNATSGDTTTTRTTTEPTQSPENDASATLTRYEYVVTGRRVPRSALPVGDATAAGELSEPTRSAIGTAVDGPRFETDDPSLQLLRDVEGLELVEYEGAYYTVSHTFTEYTVDLVADPDVGADAAVATWESLDDDSVVREALSLPLPRGPERPQRPYRTLSLPPALDQFLEDHTHLRDDDRTYRIDRTVERHFPPYTLTVDRASEQARYGERLVDVASLGEESRALLRRVRRSTDVPTGGWGDGSLYSNDVPRDVERSFTAEDGAYARLDGDAVLSFHVRDVDWDRPPVALSARAVDAPAGVELSVTNTTDDDVRLTNRGIAPFGVLWAVADGEPTQLRSPGYRDAANVDVSGEAAEPTGSADHELRPGQTLANTYHPDRGEETAEPGAYETRGVVAGEWQRSASRDGPDDQFFVYPFGVTLRVENR